MAATVTVSDGPGLVSAVNTNNGLASGGNTILLNAGTYVVSASSHAGGDPNIGLDFTKPVIVQPAVAGSSITINASGIPYAIRIQASNVTIDGLTISNASWGIQAQAVSGALLTNVILRRLSVSTIGTSGQAIAGGGLVDSVIDSCSVTSTYHSGISLSQNPYGTLAYPARNVIINNTVSNTGLDHAYAITLGDYNIIAGNTATNIAGDGILVNGGQHNYIFRNTVTNPGNGIVLTKDLPTGRQSNRNFVGNNSMTLHNVAGTDALWFDYDSNYNMGFLNEGSVAAEGGMSLFNSIGNYVRGNNFHNNAIGGIIVQKDGDSGPTVPSHNSIQQNYLHDTPANGGITINNDSQNDYGFNYIASPSFTAPTYNTAGILLNPSAGSSFYANILRDVVFAELIQGQSGIGSTGTLYENRHLTGAFRHYVDSLSTPQFDSGSSVLGGNYYAEFSSNGNPGTTSYVNGNNGLSGTWTDRYPFASESLGKNYAISVRLPAPGAYVAAGSQRTINWSSQGCTNVNLYLVNTSGSIVQTIAANLPDYGYYRWAVPSIAAGSYSVRADCLNSSYAYAGKLSTGGVFSLTSPDLVLLSPQANLISESASAMKLSWYKSSNVSSVDVYIRYSDSQAFQLLQAGVTTNSFSITTPTVSSNRVSVAIVSGSYADSTDGWFTIRGTSTGTITSPPGADNFYVGTPYLLEWISPQNTDYVTIDLISGGVTKNIATQLADFSNYLMLVPDAPGSGAYVRLTFYNSAGAVLQQISSTGGNVLYSSSQPNTVSLTGGNAQSTSINTAFPTPLQVQLISSSGFGIPGVAVTFTAPASGAGGSFSGSTTATAITNSAGIAAAPSFIANGVTGTYNVVAMADNLTAYFSLTNTTGSTTPRIGFYLNGAFALDINGNGQFDSGTDKYFNYLTPQSGDMAVYGDWNGDGRTKVGIYRNGYWILDYNGNGVYDYPTDKFYGFGGPLSDGYIPVVGDWNGSGTTKIGFYKAGTWILDYNGNGVYDPGVDKFFGLGGNANEIPFVGDWNHDGRTKAGVFYPGTNGYGTFLLDYNGNWTYDIADKIYSFAGYMAGDKPVAGDWNGDGYTKVGVFRSGFWVLDYNGNGVYEGGIDKFYGYSTGYANESPVVGDWTGSGTTKIGVSYNGLWLLDFNGDGSWSGTATDRYYAFGGTGQQPLIGKW